MRTLTVTQFHQPDSQAMVGVKSSLARRAGQYFFVSITACACALNTLASGPPEPVIVAIPKSAFKPVPMPKDDADDEADPAKLAERIASNGKSATDRLAMNDSGRDTQSLQNKILKDLDKLLNQPPPPPMGGDGGGGMPPPMGGEQPPPMGGQKPMGQGQPMPMGGQKPMGGQPMPMGQSQPMPMGGQPMPMGQGQNAQQSAGGSKPGIAGATTPSKPPPLALEDRVTKDVWGHLPPQLRQKMNQYYHEQFMPRYAELLKQYYTELAEREKEKKK